MQAQLAPGHQSYQGMEQKIDYLLQTVTDEPDLERSREGSGTAYTLLSD